MNVPDIDLYALHLFRQVAEAGSLTAAARRVGLTQSALTRQIQGLEGRLGTAVFERTTRHLSLTSAGRFLLEETSGLAGQLASTLRRLRADFVDAPREVRIGLSRSVALAHLPGLIQAHVRKAPEVRTLVSHADGARLLASVAEGTLDLAVLGRPERLPGGCQISHRMTDAFCVIAPATAVVPPEGGDRPGWLAGQPWILLSAGLRTGAQTREWLAARGMLGPTVMELDGFDPVVHLVALGLGLGFVPQRALSAFPRKRQLQRVPVGAVYRRELVVVTRRTSRPLPAHVDAFIGSILFS